MKNIAYLILGAAAACAFAGCTTAEEIGTHSDITVTVCPETSHGAARAAAPIVDGYTLKCAMQLYADDGVAVGSRSVLDASTGSAAFVIHAADLDNGATKAVFWAEYVPLDPAATPQVYDSSDLTDIRYNVTAFDAGNPAVAAAADAFTGVITDLTDGATATLTRPMIRLNFTPNNPSAARGQSKLVVRCDAPSGFNALTGACSADGYQELSVTNTTFSPDDSPWFSTLIFAPANMSALDRPVTLALSGRVDQTMTIPAGSIPLDANHIVNARADVSEAQTQDLQVEVSVDTDYVNDPNKPVDWAVGAYVNAMGRATADPAQAVAVVFCLGPVPGDSPDLYPAEFAGRSILGYAVALENVAPARLQLNAAPITDMPVADKLVNGTQNTDYLLSRLGDSALHRAWDAWTAAHAMQSAGTTTTDWYMPSRNQFEEWIAMLLPTYNLKNELIAGSPSGTAAFRALFPLNTIFDRTPFQNVMYATCSINTNGNVQGGAVNAVGDGGTVKFSQIDIRTKTQSVLARPMFTIFQ